MEARISQHVIEDTYSRAADATRSDLCCSVDYRDHFSPGELDHIPDAVLERNYGCGVPPELKTLPPGSNVLDLGPGLGRDCFVAARKVGPSGTVYGLDMNDRMLGQANRYKAEVVSRLGYDNVKFLKGRFDVRVPLDDNSIDVVFSNCVNNLALDKQTAYSEMFRVLRPGSRLSFSDIISREPVPALLRANQQAWADCVAGVLSFRELATLLEEAGFHGITLTTDYLWKTGKQVLADYFDGTPDFAASERDNILSVRLYSVMVEAYKPVVDPSGPCCFRGQVAMYHGPGEAIHLDSDPEHVFRTGELKEVCEKTAAILRSLPFRSRFTIFEPEGEVEPRKCIPGGACC